MIACADGRNSPIHLTSEGKVCGLRVMELTVHIPDEIASRMSGSGDLSRGALEALALEEYSGGRLTDPELRRLLGF